MISTVTDAMDRLIARYDSNPWRSHVGRRRGRFGKGAGRETSTGLYTPEQRRRRDKTRWTLVQGVLAPVQFLVFLVSLGLVLRYLATGAGYEAATLSIVIKTLILYTIMVTGAIWEKAVFDQYLFAPAFYWEDVVSMLVIALHTAYLAALVIGGLTPFEMMALALAAYAVYVVNAAQFLLKLRAARLESAAPAAAE
ncbi:MAG: 2-vinyl bacteriochlorophyllide hydratase [Alphaproteobacteria bacterium]|nr:2-vinyl bacteriochlorophyllide hydratase [Alphaproteobacteria bacterium]